MCAYNGVCRQHARGKYTDNKQSTAMDIGGHSYRKSHEIPSSVMDGGETTYTRTRDGWTEMCESTCTLVLLCSWA